MELYVAHKTSNTQWLENKRSKSSHFIKNNLENLDFVFIGSSRTIYHISTSNFAAGGMTVYNLGVSGMVLTDFPYFVSKAIEKNPRSIVISISVQDLFTTTMQDDFKEIALTDLRDIYSTQSVEVMFSATKSYIKSLHKLYLYSETIYSKLENLLGRFKVSIDKTKHQRGETKGVAQAAIDEPLGCSVFSRKTVSEYKTVLKCTNGDGILIGHYIPEGYEGMEKILSVPNEHYIRLLNKLIDRIKAEDIEPIIILEPVLRSHYKYNLAQIKGLLTNATVYDLTSEYGEIAFWADTSHFNHSGQAFYSNKLLKKLSNK